MSSCTSPFGARALGCWAAALSLTVTLSTAAAAQQGTVPGPPPSDAINPKAAVRERQHREANLRSSEWFARGRPDYSNSRAAAEAMKEDFVRLQVLRNEIARHVTAGKPLDYKFLTKRAGEVNKCAARMKETMSPSVSAPEKPAHGPPVDIDAEQVKSALVTLCRLIDSFTENPIFEPNGDVDVQHSTRAGGDLESIVLLSESMRNQTQRLSRARH